MKIASGSTLATGDSNFIKQKVITATITIEKVRIISPELGRNSSFTACMSRAVMATVSNVAMRQVLVLICIRALLVTSNRSGSNTIIPTIWSALPAGMKTNGFRNRAHCGQWTCDQHMRINIPANSTVIVCRRRLSMRSRTLAWKSKKKVGITIKVGPNIISGFVNPPLRAKEL